MNPTSSIRPPRLWRGFAPLGRAAFSREFLAVAILTVIYSIFAFWGLGDVEMCGDEGLMALGAKRVSHFGYPKTWDGQNLFSWEAGHDLNADLLPIHLPWLGFYIGAMGQWLFGANPFGARFGFALCGVLNLPLMYLVGRGMGLARSICAVSVFILTSLAAYFLYIRQAYHYSADVTCCLLALACYLRIERRWSPILLALCVVALFHLNHLSALWLGLSLTAWAGWDRKLGILFKRPTVWAAAFLSFLGTYLWIRWGNIMGLQASFGGWKTFLPHFDRLALVLSELDMSFPLLFVIPLLVWCGLRARVDKSLRSLFILAVCFTGIFFCLGGHQFAWLRYFLFLFPILSWVLAAWFVRMWGVHRLAGGLAALTFFLSVLPYHISHWMIGSVWRDFARFQIQRLPLEAEAPGIWKFATRVVNPMLLEVPSELAAPPLTSMGEAINYLNKHARPGEQIVSLCDSEVIQFRTRLITAYLLDRRQPTAEKVSRLPAYLTSYRETDWLLLHNHWKRNYGMMELGDYDSNQEILTYFEASGARLEAIPLRVRERFPNQLPQLWAHDWNTDIGRPTLELYRVWRKKDELITVPMR